MDDKTKYALGDDCPKWNPWEDDRLGYAPFAERISRVIINGNAPNGYVIGLHGKWGSGKSTIINFVLEYIKKHNAEHSDKQVTPIDFRPWIVAGHQDLIAAFFKVLSEELGPKGGRFKTSGKQALKVAQGNTDKLVDAAATIALTVDPTGGLVSGLLSGIAKKSVNDRIDHFLKEPSLQQACDDLKKQLLASNKHFLVTIDDIDRLEDKDVKAIMQMVKSIGQLPNVVYLLAYDREIVWRIFNQDGNRDSPHFAEKIVQQEIELPKPRKNALLSILDEEISFLVGSSADSARWRDIVTEGIHRWIRTPRDVVRLSNAVKFSWPAIEGEIDPQDLLAIEGLRLFDNGAFDWIRENRDFLFAQGRFQLQVEEMMEAAVADLKNRISENLCPQVLRLMSVLFPQRAESLEGQWASGEERSADVQKRRGIGTEAGYYAYFSMQPPSDAIPKAVVDDLMSLSEDVDSIESIIRSYIDKKDSGGDSMVGTLLEDLRVQFGASHPALPTQGLLDALFRVGEAIMRTDWTSEVFKLSPRAQVALLIQDMLEHWGPEQAGECLVQAFEGGKSPAFLAEIYVDRGRELGVFESDSRQPSLISDDDFAKLGQILLGRIQAAADDGTLKDAPYFYAITTSWAYLDNSKPVRVWLSEGIKASAEFMAKVGVGLVYRRLGTTKQRYLMKDQPEQDLYDLQVLVDAGNRHLQSAEMTDDQRDLIREIVNGSERLLHGKPLPRWGEDEDSE